MIRKAFRCILCWFGWHRPFIFAHWGYYAKRCVRCAKSLAYQPWYQAWRETKVVATKAFVDAFIPR